METGETLHGHVLSPTTLSKQQQQQHTGLKFKTGSCPGSTCSSQRRTTSGGGHSSRRSQPGCPVGSDAAVTPACTPAAAAAAAAAAFSHSAADQARQKLAALVMERQRQHKQQTSTHTRPLQSAAMYDEAMPAVETVLSNPGMQAAAGSRGGTQGSVSDLERLFEEAEDMVDTFLRHPSNPHAANLFGADVTDTLARLASTNTPQAAAVNPAMQRSAQKPSFFSQLGFRGLGLGPSQRQQGLAKHDTGDLNPAMGPSHLTGAKRSKPSFSMSRDPAADRPSSRRELANGSDYSNGQPDVEEPTAAAATAAAAGPGAMSIDAAAAPRRGFWAPTPPPSATSSAAAEAAAAGLASSWWGLDLSDSGATAARHSPFAGRQSVAAGCCKDTAADDTHSSRQPRASLQGLAPVRAGRKMHHHKSSARRSSCPGFYLARLNLSTPADTSLAGEQNPAGDLNPGVASGGTGLSGAPSAGVRVLDLSSPRSRQGGFAAADTPMSPSASPGSASSSAFAAIAAAAGAAAKVSSSGAAAGAAGQGPGISMLAAGAFGGAGGAAADGSGTAAPTAGLACPENSADSRKGDSSLPSRRDVGGVAAVSQIPKKLTSVSAAAAGDSISPGGGMGSATAAAADSPPPVFVTITSSSGLGPSQQSLSRKVSSRSMGSPASASGLTPVGGTDDMAIDSAQLEAACAAAMAAVAAEGAAAPVAAAAMAGNLGQPSQQQTGQQGDSGMPKLRPIRTKSRTEGPAAILKPAATGTAALGAVPYAPQPDVPGAVSGPCFLTKAIEQQQQPQQGGVMFGNGAVASSGLAEARLEDTHGVSDVCQVPFTPTATPATAHAATGSGRAYPASPGTLLAAAAANLAASAASAPAATAAAAATRPSSSNGSMRVSYTGTPSGIASSIAQMTLQSSSTFGNSRPDKIKSSILPPPAALPPPPSAAAAAATAAGMQAGGQAPFRPAQISSMLQPPPYQQQQQLPWQHLPACACNGVAVYPGDGGLVFVAGQTVTTGLIKTAAQMHSPPSPNASGFHGAAAPLLGTTAAGLNVLPPQPSPAPFAAVEAMMGTGAFGGIGPAGQGSMAGAAGYEVSPGDAAAAFRRMSASQLPAGGGMGPAMFGASPFAIPTLPAQGIGAAAPTGAVNTGTALANLPPNGAYGNSVPGSILGQGIDAGVLSGFGDPHAMQDELSRQQLQDLMQGSALMRPANVNFTGNYMF